MNYNVKELREKLSEKVLGLGIDAKFLENPAFASSISQIDSLISQMNMFEASESVLVREENGTISFDWVSNVGDKYSMSISSYSPEAFSCIRTEEKKPFIGTSGQTIRQKNVVEEVTTISESGFITLTTNGATIDNIDCDMGKCNNYTWAEKKYYTSDGVMRDREYKSFGGGSLSESFDRARIDSMLYIPRQAFNLGMWNDKYESRTLLVRDKLDTARVLMEDKTKGIRYSAATILSQEHGLRDMVLPTGFSYQQDVVINPLSQGEIDGMLQRENNPKVAEGLRVYAAGRDVYFYDSKSDPHFVCEGVAHSNKVSK